jgi:hypothetical protein
MMLYDAIIITNQVSKLAPLSHCLLLLIKKPSNYPEVAFCDNFERIEQYIQRKCIKRVLSLHYP